MRDTTIVMLESGSIPDPLDMASLDVAVRSVKWKELGVTDASKKAQVVNGLLAGARIMLYINGDTFVKSKVGNYNLVFVKEKGKQ